MAALATLIPLVLTASLFALVFAMALDAERGDILSILAKPWLLLKAVVAVNLIVPATAMFVVTLFPIPLPAKAGILLMAISPVPPLVPGKQMKMGGSQAYSYGIYVALALLSIVVVPLSVAFFGAYYGVQIALPPAAVARNVVISVVAPLIIGVIVQRLAPGIAKRAAGLIRKVAMILLVIAVLPVLVRVWPAFAPLVGQGTLIAIILIVVVALIAGQLLGGPEPADRGVLAVTAATRHPGIALMIAKTFIDDPQTPAAVLGFMIVGLLTAIPFQVLVKRWVARRTHPEPGPVGRTR